MYQRGREREMEKYIEGNKAAWEEAFDNRDASWGADVVEKIRKEEYAFFNQARSRSASSLWSS